VTSSTSSCSSVTQERQADTPDEWPAESFLAGLPAVMRAELLDSGTKRVFSDGETLITQCDGTKHVFVLTEGVVKVMAKGQDRAYRLIDIQMAGDTVGEIAFTDGRPRSAKVVADGTVHAVQISSRALRKFIAENPEVSIALGRLLTSRDRKKQSRYLDITQFDVKTRVARVLVDLVDRRGRETPEGLVLGVTLTQSELAALVGVADASLHKVLRALRSEGILRTTYRQITVVNRQALREIAQFEE
jgi:CRP/FNR family cyclic AMP-dependent transcriptional regulator